MLIDVFGAAAEAKLLNKDAVEIWNGPEAEGDFREAVFAATMAGLKNHEIREKLSTALERAVSLIEKPHVWRAVQAVADLLPSRGSVAGRKIYHAASRALGSALLD
ncbi:hypothetical protein EN932_10445 [Mesorhizobium sp. M7A.F.Ca.US.002.01.1.1]|uniref:hypothetical protein n=1 Tax=Mesorhizobium sp. M7A.F.Ca.US.002.01.1.1 TaxID=2496700 RepID=UPI000FD53D86|nr:hypothetical protein [Mesorhizobium sp. M7A.F.Ca.US.002.01.1.1]RVA12956.1 hypothetical protein EN932_10445 [Mesorhizobium sp. M7A.F.Ca.US.002.01.1.1]